MRYSPYNHTNSGNGVPLYSEGRIETFTTRPPHSYRIEPGFVDEKDKIPFGYLSPSPRARHHSKRRRGRASASGSTRNGCHDGNCPSARCLVMLFAPFVTAINNTAMNDPISENNHSGILEFAVTVPNDVMEGVNRGIF
ncbi:hypothetical protein TNCV_4868841 [Trichonephila clavipes]|nr:hypothetical protein TNCV_4868841 [Trichonephila clavipes]